MTDDNPLLSVLGYTAEEYLAYMENDDVYLDAYTDDGSAYLSLMCLYDADTVSHWFSESDSGLTSFIDSYLADVDTSTLTDYDVLTVNGVAMVSFNFNGVGDEDFRVSESFFLYNSDLYYLYMDSEKFIDLENETRKILRSIPFEGTSSSSVFKGPWKVIAAVVFLLFAVAAVMQKRSKSKKIESASPLADYVPGQSYRTSQVPNPTSAVNPTAYSAPAQNTPNRTGYSQPGSVPNPAGYSQSAPNPAGYSKPGSVPNPTGYSQSAPNPAGYFSSDVKPAARPTKSNIPGTNPYPAQPQTPADPYGESNKD